MAVYDNETAVILHNFKKRSLANTTLLNFAAQNAVGAQRAAPSPDRSGGTTPQTPSPPAQPQDGVVSPLDTLTADPEPAAEEAEPAEDNGHPAADELLSTLTDAEHAIYLQPHQFKRGQLRKLGTKLGIEGAHSMNKVPLVQAIKQFKTDHNDNPIPF